MLIILIIIILILTKIGYDHFIAAILEEDEQPPMVTCEFCERHVHADMITGVDAGNDGCPSDYIYVCPKCKRHLDKCNHAD